MFNLSIPLKLTLLILFLTGIIAIAGCKKEEEEPEPTQQTQNEQSTATENSDKTYTVTVGVYTLNGSTYEDKNKDFVFETKPECQTWSRTAPADKHSTESHLHYNAAKNTTYNESTETITWVEYGPEIDQTSIEGVCENGSNGATKTANSKDYTADKNFFLKIKSVEEKK